MLKQTNEATIQTPIKQTDRQADKSRAGCSSVHSNSITQDARTGGFLELSGRLVEPNLRGLDSVETLSPKSVKESN